MAKLAPRRACAATADLLAVVALSAVRVCDRPDQQQAAVYEEQALNTSPSLSSKFDARVSSQSKSARWA
jgi:hypothetical protein